MPGRYVFGMLLFTILSSLSGSGSENIRDFMEWELSVHCLIHI